MLRKNRGSLSSPCSLCVSHSDPDSLVTHKTQLPAGSQERLPSSACYLAATTQIRICSNMLGSDSAERRQEPCGSLEQCSRLLLCPPPGAQTLGSGSSSLPCPMPFTFPLTGQNRMPAPEPCWSRAPLRGRTVSALLLGAQPIGSAREMFPQISASWGEATAGGGKRARGGAKLREPLGGAQGQRLSFLGSSLQNQEVGVPPKPPCLSSTPQRPPEAA